MAAGAALGLLCGPGGPVYCVITGIVGGFVGGEAASTMVEAIWNFPQTARMMNDVIEDLEERKLQQLVEKSGGTMPPAVQDAARRSGVAIFFAPERRRADGKATRGQRHGKRFWADPYRS